jgi:large subunit ribosomal protein L25
MCNKYVYEIAFLKLLDLIYYASQETLMTKTTFTAETRTLLGKKSKNLRQDGNIPANIMGRNVDSQAITIHRNQFIKLYQEVGDTGLVYLTVDGEKTERPLLVSQVDLNPVSGDVEHVVFKQVDLKEKITAEIPVEIVGEFDVAGAVLLTVHDAIEVEALPTDLPESFEVNVESLTEIGQAITFKDLKYDASKVELKVSEEELESPIVVVQELKEEEPEEEATETEAGAETPEAAPAAEEAKPEATE